MGTAEGGSVLRPVRSSALRPPDETATFATTPSGDGASPIGAVVGFGIPFLLILTLAVQAGGYDIVLRSQVGIIVWWALLLGLSAGLLPSAKLTRPGWGMLASFAGVVAITALATLTWTESVERSVIEFSRTITLFGIFTLMLLIQGRHGLRRSLAAVGAAVAVVAVIALGDRFDPGLLPFGSSELLPAGYPRARLNYPLEYWNGLAAMMAIGMGPLLWGAVSARDRFVRAIAAGVLPLTVLATYLTASRGGTASAAVALLALVLLFPQRLRLMLGSLAPAVGSAVLIVAANRRPEVRDLIPGDQAAAQGTEMIWMSLAVVLTVAAIQALVTGLIERGALRIPTVRREVTRLIGGAFGATVVLLLTIGLASGFFSNRWSEFKQPVEQGTVSRLGSVNSSERYFLWKSALDAADSEKLTGIGPGAFEYWWARNGDGEQFVRDAHSLYLEFLAESGPAAFLLILLLVFGPIVYGVMLSASPMSSERRTQLAAATAGMVGFAVAAGVDWAWELTVLPVAFFALAAAALGPDVVTGGGPGRDRAGADRAQQGRQVTRWAVRAAMAVGCVLAIAVIAVPLAGTQALNSSQEMVGDGDVNGALADAERSSGLQPWAASPRVQQAQVLDLLGRRQEAIRVAREAVDLEPVNWRNWLVLSETLAARPPSRSRRALRRALRLNPRSDYLRQAVQELR